MRYFKLQNSNGELLDITTTEIFFHDISGLGFEEDNEFRNVGPLWRLNSTRFSQTPVSGSIIFSEEGNTTPYEKYQSFRAFVSAPPLVLIYYPFGLNRQAYNKIVRVSSLAKTEINEYGVLDSEIEFTPYTPWYLIKSLGSATPEVDTDSGWIWDVGNIWDNQVEGGPKYKFGSEPVSTVIFRCDAEGLVKLTIFGPALNPTWMHHVDGKLVASGGIDSNSTLRINEGEYLTIDNTEGAHIMTVSGGGTVRNVYSLRDFDLDCFFKLQKGINSISAASSDSTALSIIVEGHEFYATV